MNKGVAYQGYYNEYYQDRQWSQYSFLLSDVVKYSHPGTILDIGAGLGFFVELSHRWGIDCCGLEGAEEAVKVALERNPDLNIKQHYLSEPLPFEEASIQTIVINQVIEHLEPSVAHNTLIESYRILKKGGLIYITSPSRFNIEETLADSTHINMYSPGELRQLVSSVGFSNITSFDYNLPFLGNSALGLKLAGFIFRIGKKDSLSATANVIGYKL